MTNPLEELSIAISEYFKGRLSMNTEELVDVRDRISLCMLYSAKYCSDCRTNAEAKQFYRKLSTSEKAEELREGRKLSRERINSITIVECKKAYEEEIEANREYYRTRQIIDSVPKLLDSIASRIRILNKNG